MDIQEIKQIVGQAAETTIANGLGMYKRNNKYKCIDYLSHKNGDKNPSMSWDAEALQFYCFTCRKKIDIYTYYREYERKEHKEIIEMFETIPRQEVISKAKPVFNPALESLNQECFAYLTMRGLLRETIDYFKVMTFESKIAITYGEPAAGVKLRKPMKVSEKPKYTSITGSAFSLYNRERIDTADTLIITEGEFDCMVVYQCGYKNVVSIPTGAATKLDSERPFFERFESVIIVSDNDDAGNLMDKHLINLLGTKAKMIDKGLYKGLSDVNALYVKYGQDAVRTLIESGVAKIKGLRDLIKNPYSGLTNKNVKFIPTGIDGIDDELNDLESRRTTLVTGRPGEGKSTFVDRVGLNAIDKGFRLLLVDGEHDQDVLINNLYKKVIGNEQGAFNLVKYNKKYLKEPKKEVQTLLNKWHEDKLFIFSKGDSEIKNLTALFKSIIDIVKTKKIDLIILDNLMSLIDAGSETMNALQSEFMKATHYLAINENCHVIIVAHPNKTAHKGESIDYFQVSGTADLANLADNIIQIRRNFKEEDSADAYIEIHKNRGYGTFKESPLYYDKETSSLYEIVNGQATSRKFNWKEISKKEGWEDTFEDISAIFNT